MREIERDYIWFGDVARFDHNLHEEVEDGDGDTASTDQSDDV